jgi:hypothetical protein
VVALIIAILFTGFVVYLIRSAPFIDAWFKNLAYGVVCLCLIIWVLNFVNLGSGISIH